MADGQTGVDDAAAREGAAAASDVEKEEDDLPELSLETQKEIPDDAPGWIPDSGAPGQGPHAWPEEPAAEPDTSDAPDGAAPEKRPLGPPGFDRPIVVDASDHVAGRLSSHVAKLLLQGKRVSLVNCEKIMISGTRANTIHEYRQFLKINSIINPKHGPVHYRRPDTVITKMIRGMLPFEKKPSGRHAHKRLRAYIGSPKQLKPFRKVQFEKAKITRPASSYTTMGELCRVIGWTE